MTPRTSPISAASTFFYGPPDRRRRRPGRRPSQHPSPQPEGPQQAASAVRGTSYTTPVEVGIPGTEPSSYRGRMRKKPILLALIVSAFFALNLPGANSAPPTLVAPVLSASVTGTEVSLKWTDAGGETSYHVMGLPPAAVTWTEIATLRADTLQYKDSGLSPSTTYHYVVVATRGWKQMNSNAVQVTTGATPSLPPPSPSPSPSLPPPSPSPSPSSLPSPSPSYSPSPSPRPSPSLSPSPSPSPSPPSSGLPIVGPQSSITCPAGSVNIGTSMDIQAMTNQYAQGTTFCLKAGTHNMRAPVFPKSNDTYVGEFGAILDGTGWTTTDTSLGAAFSGAGRDIDNVTIRNLVIRNFPQRGIHACKDLCDGWTINHNELYGSVTGINHGNYSEISWNYIHDNSQYGIIGYQTTGSVIENNEFAYNAWDHPNHIGDSANSKWANVTNTTVRNNNIHDNRWSGIWFDGNGNSGNLVEGNTVTNNLGNGIFNEAAGSLIVRNNTITNSSQRNIYISESHDMEVYGNTLSGGPSSSLQIGLFQDGNRVGETVMQNDSIHDNYITVPSGGMAIQITCSNLTATACSLYSTSHNIVFRNNHYTVPSLTSRWWYWNQAYRDWAGWRGQGQDTTGTIQQG
jgi:parallel beta-helix repeat protein